MIMNRISGINRQSPVPLYYQLKEILLELIESGEVAPNTLIPTEKELEELSKRKQSGNGAKSLSIRNK